MLKILIALKNHSEAILRVVKGHKVDVLREKKLKSDYNVVLLEEDLHALSEIKAFDPRIDSTLG